MKPGMSTLVPRSVTAAPGAAFVQSSSDPTAMMVPVEQSMATASARGVDSSIVMMDAALRMT